MKNTNFNICSNCDEKNPLFLLNCRKCHHYTRENVVNIDLWKTIFQLFDAPTKALKYIIYAEHKNFITFLLFFLGLKFYLTSVLVQSSFNYILPVSKYISYNILAIMGIYIVVILIFSKLISVLLKKMKRETRFKDNLSIIVYAFTPLILTSFMLLPIEYGIYGQHWFIYNPSPFLIKSTPAYILAGIEIIMLVWSLIILLRGFYLQANSIKTGILLVGLFVLLEVYVIINLPYIMF